MGAEMTREEIVYWLMRICRNGRGGYGLLEIILSDDPDQLIQEARSFLRIARKNKTRHGESIWAAHGPTLVAWLFRQYRGHILEDERRRKEQSCSPV
jgi:hypothetical protein